MAAKHLRREQILAALVEALEPQEHVLALWEGGAAAFNRVDEWSDTDLQVVVRDEHVQVVFDVVERTFERLSTIADKVPLPQPTWHGHHQTFYRLAGTSPCLMIDLVVMQESNPRRFLERAIHGRHVVHFDKAGLITPEPLDVAAFTGRIADRLAKLQAQFDLFQLLVLKELSAATGSRRSSSTTPSRCARWSRSCACATSRLATTSIPATSTMICRETWSPSWSRSFSSPRARRWQSDSGTLSFEL